MAERFPGVPGGTRREHVTKSHKAEQWAHSARIAHIMSALVAVCGQFESVYQQIMTGITWCKVNMQRLSYYLKPGQEECDFADFVRTFGNELAQCEQLAIKGGKAVPTDKQLKLTPQASDDIQSALLLLHKIASILNETCGIASVQININPGESASF
ncbi:unnamed protein product [Strongylus vulgaris]|uniref:Uncharacterized protein n=1 Tax=Strongylus vulgaris TaxID=40348 RepID=A0A3P7JH63_STRVU|nr:unnamed protein product [Strongylus vulgaris]